MKPLVSILIPAYNAEQWIGDSIQSALAQTWERKEIIIVDDGSTDRTGEMARRHDSAVVKVVSQENQGGCVARNRAYDECQGDYIQWLDADDMLAEDKIERQMNAAQESGSERILLSSAWGVFYFRRHKVRLAATELWSDLSPYEWLCRKLEQNIFMQTGAWLVSRALAEAAGPWDTRLRKDQDGEYSSRLVARCDHVRFVPEAMAYHRSSGTGSVSYMGQSKVKQDSQFLAIKLCIEYLGELKEDERARQAAVKYLQHWMFSFFPERADIVAEARELAEELGGKLETPRMPAKYAWLEKPLGFRKAKAVRRLYNRRKAALARGWDRVLFALGG